MLGQSFSQQTTPPVTWLSNAGNGYLSIDPTDEGEARWSIKYRHKLPISLGSTRWFSRVRSVGSAEELERAIQTADKYAERTLGRDLYSKLSRYAEWRRRPASEKAVAMLLKVRGVKEPKDVTEVDLFGRQVPLSKLTAGQVASCLCVLVACSWYAKADSVDVPPIMVPSWVTRQSKRYIY